VWAGHPHNLGDQLRTVTLAALAPLFGVPGTQWVSLQKGVAAEQLRELSDPSRVIDIGKDLRDFADTAAILEQLDLLISVDTSGAHLAGALARRVWMLTPFVSDWRWLTDRTDSPWYPTMRLFRQSKPGDWGDVVGDVVRELVAMKIRI
jgi:ADP-heptose:LPS heptosyltransferase